MKCPVCCCVMLKPAQGLTDFNNASNDGQGWCDEPGLGCAFGDVCYGTVNDTLLGGSALLNDSGRRRTVHPTIDKAACKVGECCNAHQYNQCPTQCCQRFPVDGGRG